MGKLNRIFLLAAGTLVSFSAHSDSTLALYVLDNGSSAARIQTGLPSSYDQLIAEVLTVTNRERTKLGLKPLKLNNDLNKSAQWMAQDLAVNNYFSHTDSQGRGIGDRIPSFGYNYASLRENLAAGHESAEEVVDAWLKSPGHRDNLLAKNVDEIGLGYFYLPNSKYKRYWVQDFGRQR